MADDASRESGERQVESRPYGWICDGPAGSGPWGGRALVILAHGAGAPLTSPFLEATAAGLTARGLSVMRFNFPYMESMVRGGPRRPPDGMRVLLATWKAIVDEPWPQELPLVLAGKSMGGRVASMLLADGEAPQASGAIYLGYPLHPPGRPEKLRSAHLPEVPVPQLFVQGTRDSLCRLDLLEKVLEGLGDVSLHVVEGGDHSLAVRRGAPVAGDEAWLDVIAAFVDRVTSTLERE